MKRLVHFHSVRALFCKEAAGVLSTVRGRLRVLFVAVALSAIALVIVASTTLKLAGNGWAVAAMLTAVTFVGALAGMLSGIDATEGERKRGNLVLLFLTPLSREEIAAGKLGAPAAGALASLVVAVPYLWAMADLQQGLGAAISVLLLFGAPLILAFGVLGLGIGARLASSRAAVCLAVITIVLFAVPLAASTDLHNTSAMRAVARFDPLSNAVNAFYAVALHGESIVSQVPFLIPIAVFFVLSLIFAISSMRILSLEEA